MATRRKLAAELIRRGLAENAGEADSLITAHRVIVGGSVADNPDRMVTPAESLHVEAEPDRYVGRGGHKLEAALAAFEIDPAGASVLDVGASTGGFTDCLLQHGAAHVTCVDTGRNQLHQRLRTDVRVTNMEQTDIRRLDIDRQFDIVSVDVSFISVKTIAGALVRHLRKDGDLVILVKPQFESTRAEATQGRGVITDRAIWARTLAEALNALSGLGAATMGAMRSPIRGAQGNVEFLTHHRLDRTAADSIDAMVAGVV